MIYTGNETKYLLKKKVKETGTFIKLEERFACETEYDELGKKIPTMTNSNLKFV